MRPGFAAAVSLAGLLWVQPWIVLARVGTGETATVETGTEQEAKPWIGRYEAFEEYLRTAEMVREEATPVGITKPRRIFFAPGGLMESAVAKPLRTSRDSGWLESYQHEIAAYELDKLLGLDMVPPTVERRYQGQGASAQYWVNDTVWLKELQTQKLRAPDTVAWNRQIRRLRVFDNLIANIDRNEGNMLVVRNPTWHLILIDHSRAFTNRTEMVFEMSFIDRPLFERLKALDTATLDARVGTLLLDGSRPILRRRDRIVAHFEKLARQKGDAAVFTQ